MKMTKKAIGIALAIVMLLNVFAFSAFAAYPDDAACALIITPDKTSYSAGDTITFTVSTKATADVGNMTCGGQYEIGYNSAAIAPISTGTDMPDHNFVINPELATGYDESISQVIFTEKMGSSITAASETAYGWNELIMLCVAESGTRVTKACADTALPIFTFQMKVSDTAADGTYTVGFNRDGYETNYTAYINDEVNTGLYGNDGSAYNKTYMFDFGTCEVVVGAAAPTVTTTDPQVQWQDAANGKMKMGFTGKIAGFTPVYSSGDELSNITACGVIYSIDSAATLEVGAANTTTVPCYTIYGDATGTDFTFRAIMSDVPYEGTGAMYFRAYIVYNGTTIYGAADSTTANAEYLEGVTAGLAAFGA